MIKEDISFLTKLLPYEADVYWLDSSLHDNPENLNKEICRQVDMLDESGRYDRIILTFMYCGRALYGISSKNSYLHFSKYEDCIEAMLHAREEYKSLRSNCFFLSHGWLNEDNNVIEQYHRYVAKYGEKRARLIYSKLYGCYKELAVVECPEDRIDSNDKIKIDEFCELTSIGHCCIEGSLDVFRRLLFLDDSEDICVLPSGMAISPKDFFCADTK